MAKIDVLSREVQVLTVRDEDYICITDIARYKDAERTDYLISNWLRNRNTIDFLGIWEKINNPAFIPIEFDGIKKDAGMYNGTYGNRGIQGKGRYIEILFQTWSKSLYPKTPTYTRGNTSSIFQVRKNRDLNLRSGPGRRAMREASHAGGIMRRRGEREDIKKTRGLL
jgi:hypothetical protein